MRARCRRSGSPCLHMTTLCPGPSGRKTARGNCGREWTRSLRRSRRSSRTTLRRPSGRACPLPLDKSFTDLQQEILSLQTRSLHDSWVVAMFQRDFLHHQFHCHLGPVTGPDQRPCTFCECWAGILCRHSRSALGCALVLTEFRCCQAIVSIFGFLVSKQSGDRESPSTARTRPAHVRIALNPYQ